MKRRVLGVVIVLGFTLLAGEKTTDFRVADSSAPDGWDVSQTSYDANNGRSFTDSGKCIISPEYAGAVVSFSVSARMFGSEIAGSGSALIVEACRKDDDSWQRVLELVFANGSQTNETVQLSRAANLCRFRLTFKKGAGTLRIRDFSATWREEGEVDVPRAVVASRTAAGTCHAAWDAVDAADGYRVYLWRESRIPWAGTILWGETFAGCVNAGKNPKALDGEDLDAAADHLGWRGENVYLPVESTDMLQINKADSSVGWLQSPALPQMAGATLVVRARAHTMQPDHVMPVYLVHEGATNECAQFELTEEMVDYAASGLNVMAGDRLLFRSFTVGKQRRVLLDAVYFVGDDYAAAHTATNWVVQGETVTATEWTSAELEAEAGYRFAVRAVMGASESEMSESVSVAPLPQEDVVGGAVALSTLASSEGCWSWRENFDVFTNVYTESDSNVSAWTNGVTVPHWQLYVGDTAPEKLSRNFGAAAAADFYAYWATNKVVDTYSLGTLTSGEKADLVYGVAFRNDTAGDVRRVRVRYEGLQFGFKNTVEQSLQCECLVTNEEVSVVAPGDWRACDALRFTTPVVGGGGLESGKDLPVRRSCSTDDLGVRIPRGGCLLIRWRRMKTTSAAAMAIDNVEMAFESAIQPTVMILR